MENPAMAEVKTDLRQTSEYGDFLDKIGWTTVRVKNVQVFFRKLGPVSIAKIQRVSLPLPWEEISKELKERRVIMCKLEPRENQPDGEIGKIKKWGFKPDKWPLLGAKTLRVNLEKSEEKLMQSFKKDARYCLKKALEAAVEIKIDDWEVFYDVWKKAARNKDLWIPPKKDVEALKQVFGGKCFCLTAGRMAGVVIIVIEKTAYYYYSATLPEAKKLQLPYRMVWEAMREAKKRGAVAWDFEGIYDSRWPSKGWKGFSHFKKSFGGTEVELPGSFTKWRLPV